MKKLKTVKFEDIQTPTTVEEFRENLRKYVGACGENTIYVQGHDGISIDDISSLSDIYTLTQTGFSGTGSSPNICMKVDWSFDGAGGVTEFMKKTEQCFSCDGYWEDPDSQFTIYEGEDIQISDLPVAKWSTLDNQVLRELYMKMFGAFSGYEFAPLKEVA